MHRSSESVAAIATALAKAQTELSNPEKVVVGTYRQHPVRQSRRAFRYASLSSGLDIIRKTLGGQQIAVAQTTDIDRANGSLTSRPSSCIPQENGSRRTGRSAPYRRYRTPPHGGGAHLCPALRPVHFGRDRRRGRPRRARPFKPQSRGEPGLRKPNESG